MLTLLPPGLATWQWWLIDFFFCIFMVFCVFFVFFKKIFCLFLFVFFRILIKDKIHYSRMGNSKMRARTGWSEALTNSSSQSDYLGGTKFWFNYCSCLFQFIYSSLLVEFLSCPFLNNEFCHKKTKQKSEKTPVNHYPQVASPGVRSVSTVNLVFIVN